MPIFTALMLALSNLGLDLNGRGQDCVSARIGEWSKLRPAVIDEMATTPAVAAAYPSSPLLGVGDPNSVSLFLYGPSAYAPDEDGEIFYLPLGQRVYTDEHAALPAHPQYGRIVEITTADHARQVECFAYPYVDEDSAAFRVQGDEGSWTQTRTEGNAVRFDFEDGLVSFVTPTSEWFLDGQQIESYECR